MIDGLGCRPNSGAWALANGRTSITGLVFPPPAVEAASAYDCDVVLAPGRRGAHGPGAVRRRAFPGRTHPGPASGLDDGTHRVNPGPAAERRGNEMAIGAIIVLLIAGTAAGAATL
ncbi:hypothetical protein [Streptomyces sp. ADMS]|uniref:hypothetical protein n=1 Tax=Streptomyces sp. ADMS TaxID=3071415 RepID=UPI0039921C75